jgi:uncharacterized protein YjiS (DUF1127 family)
VSEKHLDHILRRAAEWYNYRRCHSARGNLPPVRDEGDPPVITNPTMNIWTFVVIRRRLRAPRENRNELVRLAFV